MASGSSSEDDDSSRKRRPRQRNVQELFKPKKSLARTPPDHSEASEQVQGSEALLRTPPSASMASSLYKTVLSAISPKQTTSGNPASKRIRSPQEESEEKRPRRLGVPSGTPMQEQEYHTPRVSLSDENDTDCQGKPSLNKSSGRQLLSLANQSGRRINDIIRGPMSRLNKGDTNAINSQVTTLLEIVGHLAIELANCTANNKILETKLDATTAALEGERRNKSIQEETIAAVSTATAEIKAAVGSRAVGETFADKVKAGRGPVVALFPQEGNRDTIKTSEDTNIALKASIAPANLNIKIDKVRKIGGAGVLIQTKTQEDLNKLKAAIPPNLKTSEVKGREPLVAIRNVDGAHTTLPDILRSVHEQNFKDDGRWTIENLSKECRLAFKKGRPNSNRSTLVVACSTALRRALIGKGRLYIGWEVVTVEDYTTAICCRRCQLYGHSIKNCKAEKPTCGKCGESHDTETCKAAEQTHKCATCSRFGQPAGGHKTASRDCPARVYAEKRMAEATNY